LTRATTTTFATRELAACKSSPARASCNI
jgi:hypothetical protein